MSISRTGAAPASWASYVPVLSASVTNPTLGSGSVQEGYFVQIGKLVIAKAYIAFGTSGASAGSGEYEISLPVSARSGITVATGVGHIRDASAGTIYVVNAQLKDATKVKMWPNGVTTTINHSNPFAWAASDLFLFSFEYEAA